MTYGYVYVAQVSMGANLQQTSRQLLRQRLIQDHPSSSVTPSEMHSIKGGMAHAQEEMKKAVETGYWNSIASTQLHLQ